MNIVKRILKANQGRDPERLAMKYLALRSGPFPFLRGTCHLFYDRLASSGFGASAPPVWCCGDLHLENFGNYLNSRTRLVRKRRRLLVDGRRALPVPQAERDAVCATVHAFALSQRDPYFFRVLDVGRRIAGTGSLGVARYVLLVEGHGSPDRNYLFDLKQAVPSVLGRHFRALQPRWTDEAHRIAGVQRRMQAVSAACPHPLTHAGQGFVLRDLQPSEDRLPFERFGTELERIEAAVFLLARCLAWAQLRSSGRQGSAIADDLIDFAAKKKWQGQLARASAAMAAQVNADWAAYAAAYDAGQFQVDAGE